MARATLSILFLLLLGLPATRAADAQVTPADGQVDKPAAARVSPSLAPYEPPPQPAPLVPTALPTFPTAVATQTRPDSTNLPPEGSLACQGGACPISEEDPAYQLRLENRLKPKFTLDIGGALGSVGPPGSVAWALAASALFGYRQNYMWWLGAVLRAGPFFGPVSFSSGEMPPSEGEPHGPGTTSLGGLMAEAGPFLGPFGRFYAGPLLWTRYIAFSDNTLYSPNGKVTLRDGWTGGIGLHFGTVLGSREQTVLSFAITSSKMNTQTFFIAATIGFQTASISHASEVGQQ